MDRSFIGLITSALSAARSMGLGENEQKAAACAVLLAREPELTLGIARVLVDRLADSCAMVGA